MIELTTWEDIRSFRKQLESTPYTSITGSLENGYLYINVDNKVCRIHGNWEEREKTKLINWLGSLSDQLFDLLKKERFIYGKDKRTNIVSCEYKNGEIIVFFEDESGVYTETFPYKHWMLTNTPLKDSKRLDGDLFFKYIKYYDNEEDLAKEKYGLKYKNGIEAYSVYDKKEAAMLLHGFTYYKGMKVKDVSLLSFDIEALTLEHTEDAKVILISNTYRKGDYIEKKLFAYDEYESEADFFNDWCNWVRDRDPSIILGYNIFGYDLPMLDFCARKAGTALVLGRDGSEIRFDNRMSKFRRDGSLDFDYKRAFVFGREIVDQMFVTYHYDVATRQFESYKLKAVVSQLGLEKEGRQHYDASKIAENYLIPEEYQKIKAYANDDADDPIILYDIMVPAYFYSAQSIPKSFQSINCGATGSMLNSFLIRSYLQDEHSIPKSDEVVKFDGAISFGIPGIYNNVNKIDTISLYPSIMRQYKVCDEKKDPRKHLIQMVEYFTKERLKNKQKAKETGDKYYKDLEQAQKVLANSIYGLLGAQLNFNSPKNAEFVTAQGREIIKKSIMWATGKPYEYWYEIFERKTGKKKKDLDEDS